MGSSERGSTPGRLKYSMMNCFDWHNRSSDYLDGSLAAEPKREADEHLESCGDCRERHQHYRLILASISNQPRSTLPVPIRKAPLAAALPRMDIARMSRSRWEQVPWYIRTTAEGTGIVLLILLGISYGPKLRALFERNLERNMGEFAETLGSSSPGDGSDSSALNLPLSRGKNLASAGAETAKNTGASDTDSFASEGDDDDDTSTAEGGGVDDGIDESSVRVGAQEIWRFNMKTDSPHEIRPRIVQLLTDLNIPTSTPGLGGTEAPGGIQFDLMLPQSVVPALKKQLQRLAPPTPEGLAGSPVGETFTWYKNRSKHPIPSGQTHVVIWLSQM
jgi:hypothetical protein